MITGGMIAVEDGNKANEQFAPARKVRVELTFSVLEGENAADKMLEVSTAANQKVNELLGRVVTGRRKAATIKPQAEAIVVEEPINPATSEAPLIVEELVTPAAVVKRVQKATDAALIKEPATPSHNDVYKAVSATQAQLKNAKAIVALIRKHTADQPAERQTVAGIPENRRQAFLDDLEMLKAGVPA